MNLHSDSRASAFLSTHGKGLTYSTVGQFCFLGRSCSRGPECHSVGLLGLEAVMSSATPAAGEQALLPLPCL